MSLEINSSKEILLHTLCLKFINRNFILNFSIVIIPTYMEGCFHINYSTSVYTGLINRQAVIFKFHFTLNVKLIFYKYTKSKINQNCIYIHIQIDESGSWISAFLNTCECICTFSKFDTSTTEEKFVNEPLFIRFSKIKNKIVQ